MPQSGKIRVLSNSLKYSEELASQLSDTRFHLVTSVDAGTEKTFKNLRGKSGIDDVVANLVRYQALLDDPRRLTVKYIVGASNFASIELKEYVEKITATPLLRSLFQISCDFTLDVPDDGLVCALYELSLRLLNAGASLVFFDDLVRDRVRITLDRADSVQNHLAKEGIDTRYLLTPQYPADFVLWGSGKQSHWLTTETLTGQSGCIIGTVSDASSYQTLCITKTPNESQSSRTVSIFPAGVQSMFDIVRNIENDDYGARILRGVML